jgi:hypothetical protein
MMFEVTFFKKWLQEIETIIIVYADNADDAVSLIIDIDNNNNNNNKVNCLGLEDLEYSVKKL